MFQKRQFLFIVLAFLIASCGTGADEAEPRAYLPPSPAVSQPTPASLPPTQVIALPTLESLQVICQASLRFLEDLTIPDNSAFPPGAEIDKQWLVENSGTCDWDDRFRLKLVNGVSMGLSAEQMLYPARAGTQAVIRMVFTAPAEPGIYRSEWQAFGPDSLPFGDPVFIMIVVSP